MAATSTTATWILTLVGNIACLLLGVQMLRFWIAKDWPRMCTALIGAMTLLTLVFNPSLPMELAARLRATVAKNFDADPAPVDHGTTTPDETGHTDSTSWGTIAIVAGTIAALIALLLIASALAAVLRRRRERTQAQSRHDGELSQRRAELETRHDAVREAYGDFEMNLLDNLHRLALADVNVTQTARLIDALDAARDARISTAPETLDTYRKTVTALEAAFKSADHHARTTGARYLPPAERRNIEQAQAALAVALDERGYAPQRQIALRRALTLIESVIPVPKEAMAALEMNTRPALTKN
ncbi:hypothetical protein [Streptomyces sp. WM6378]|uniref:hypothetical protein n=1 Tax=Streptomyces sp. WM6378 TaxID=1415557 RepID=UPI000A676222|nr:hypothetical protein [Streptomyces sp. WM6378]